MNEVAQAVDELVEATEVEVDASVRVVDSVPSKVKVFNRARGVLAQFALFLVLLYFKLAKGRVLMRKWSSIVKTTRNQERVRTICSTIEDQCGSYLISISLINVCLGLAVALATAALGLPNPAFWGAVAAVLLRSRLIRMHIPVKTPWVVRIAS